MSGYPETQLRSEWSEDKFKDFMKWMRGQTFTSCDGWSFDHKSNRLIDSNCGPHGYVYYVTDVHRFLAGGRVVD